MHTDFRALLRSIPLSALSFGALTLFSLVAPHSAAAVGGPNVTITSSRSTIPAIGAVVTVTAQVTAASAAVSSVVLYENHRPGYGNPGRSAPMTSSDGITYTATVVVDINTDSNANGEVLYVEATDAVQTVTDVTAATQGYDNLPPSITAVTSSPDPIPVQGATVTVVAKVADTGVGLASVVLYENHRPGYGNPGRSAPMASSDGITYTATIPVDLNSATGENGESLYITAINQANNSTDYIVATQGYSSVPATGSLPVLITADPAVPVLSPATVAPGGAILPLTIHGINFASGATVLFNGVQFQTAPDGQADRRQCPGLARGPRRLVPGERHGPVSRAAFPTVSTSSWRRTASTFCGRTSRGRFRCGTSRPIIPTRTRNTVPSQVGPRLVSVGSDGKAHILWNHSPDGQVSLWDITGGSYAYTLYGPFAGWSAVSVATGQ